MADGEYYIGLMSGTSADAVDAALVDFGDDRPALMATHCEPLEPATRATIHKLARPGPDEIDQLGALDRELGRTFARAVEALLAGARLEPRQIIAIGSHGQTLRHRPPDSPAGPFTLQVADPNLIAHLTGITTVADFRRRDMAAGGQGAPLVPALHRALFQRPETDRAIVNIGGVANITWLPAHGEMLGFDTGPGNNLMDAWIGKSLGEPFDRDGDWSRQGRASGALLERLRRHPYFARPAPKSTGPETFHLNWLEQCLTELSETLQPADVQATLLQLTAHTIADGFAALTPGAKGELYLCGGGAHNRALREALAERLPHATIADTGTLGLDPDWVEAVAFAWLARQRMKGLAGNLPAVTGAQSPQVLGAVYSA